MTDAYQRYREMEKRSERKERLIGAAATLMAWACILAIGAAIIAGIVYMKIAGAGPSGDLGPVPFAIFSCMLIGAGLIYALPYIVARARSHPNALPIGLLTLFLGWTLVGWVVAICWATYRTGRIGTSSH